MFFFLVLLLLFLSKNNNQQDEENRMEALQKMKGLNSQLSNCPFELMSSERRFLLEEPCLAEDSNYQDLVPSHLILLSDVVLFTFRKGEKLKLKDIFPLYKLEVVGGVRTKVEEDGTDLEKDWEGLLLRSRVDSDSQRQVFVLICFGKRREEKRRIEKERKEKERKERGTKKI